jgi:hypothetical protein
VDDQDLFDLVVHDLLGDLDVSVTVPALSVHNMLLDWAGGEAPGRETPIPPLD